MKRFAAVLLACALTGSFGSGAVRAAGAWAGQALPAAFAAARGGLLADGRLSRAQREQLREQLRSADRDLYRRGRRGEPNRRDGEVRRQRREPRWRLSPEQRRQLREDIMDANRRFRRR